MGQAARYMGWLRHELAAPGQPVEGIIVAEEADAKLYHAATAVPGLSVKVYEVSLGLEPAPVPMMLLLAPCWVSGILRSA